MQEGETIQCVIKEIEGEKKRIKVSINDGSEWTIPYKYLFHNYNEMAIRNFENAVYHRRDLLRTGMDFVAEVIEENNRLILSRAARILVLWDEIKNKSEEGGNVLATVYNSSRDTIFARIEGNLRAEANSTKLENFIQEKIKERYRWYMPTGGDTVWARVASAESIDRPVKLDFVSSLSEMEREDGQRKLLEFLSSGMAVAPNETSDEIPSEYIENLYSDWVPTGNIDRKCIKVLIVDDDPTFLEIASMQLLELEYNVDTAASAEEAMAKWENESAYQIGLIDIVMQPKNGLELVTFWNKDCQPKQPRRKCILISGYNLDNPLPGTGKTIREQCEPIKNLYLYWHKDSDIKRLDRLILEYDRIIETQSDDVLAIYKKPDISEISENLTEKMNLIMSELKRITNSDFGAVFCMNPIEWKVTFLAGEDFLWRNSQELNAQIYLPNSPIRDIIYDSQDFRIDDNVPKYIDKYRNLLRFFGDHLIEEYEIPTLGFKSCISVRLNIPTKEGYCLFLFSKNVNYYQNVNKTEIQLFILRLERIIIEDLYTERQRIYQPFIRDGELKTGLSHDVLGKLRGMEWYANSLNKALNSNQQGGQLKQWAQTLGFLITSAKEMAMESLRRKHTKEEKEFDVVECLESAERTANGYIMMYFGNNTEIPPISITKTRVEDVQKMFGEELYVERIFENILINAVQQVHEFYRDTGKIFIEIFADDKDERLPIKVLVHDTGPGIHRRDYSKIFRPLYTTKKDGYGMGLTVVKQIADSIGARVSVQNSVMLAGTTFLIELPKTARPHYNEI